MTLPWVAGIRKIGILGRLSPAVAGNDPGTGYSKGRRGRRAMFPEHKDAARETCGDPQT